MRLPDTQHWGMLTTLAVTSISASNSRHAGGRLSYRADARTSSTPRRAVKPADCLAHRRLGQADRVTALPQRRPPAIEFPKLLHDPKR